MNIERYIDHTYLKSDANTKLIKKICDEAKQYNFASVCVNPYFVKLVSQELQGTNTKACAVIAFPLGANTSATKCFEADEVLKNGAKEVDMVINIGALKDGNYKYVENEIKSIYNLTKGTAILKVIVETCLLSSNEKENIIKLVRDVEAEFIKTSTGFSISGATLEDIRLFKKFGGDKLKIKASGGIKTFEDALKMIEAGADRIGTSSGISIVLKKIETVNKNNLSNLY